jgi:hypothetical protein
VRCAPILLVAVLGACAPGAAASPTSPVPTAPAATLPPAPPRSILTDVRTAVLADRPGPGPFELLLVAADTALATDDRSWAATVRREGGTWHVAEVASLG